MLDGFNQSQTTFPHREALGRSCERYRAIASAARAGNPMRPVNVQMQMMTRRSAVLMGLGLSAAASAWAKDFWNEKKPSEWTEGEIQQMLTKSP